LKVNQNDLPDSGLPLLSNFVTSNHSVCEKLEKRSLQRFCDRPRSLLVRHSFANSEALDRLSRVIVVNVGHRMLPRF
jgi:hypothetical protein